MAITAYTLCTVSVRQVSTTPLATLVDVLNMGATQSFSSGTGYYNVNLVYAYTGSIAPSSIACFNVRDGSLTDNFGNSVVLDFWGFKAFFCTNLATLPNSYFWLGTFAGQANRHLLTGVSLSPITIRTAGQFFYVSPQYSACGTVLKIKSNSAHTAHFKFMVLGNDA